MYIILHHKGHCFLKATNSTVHDVIKRLLMVNVKIAAVVHTRSSPKSVVYITADEV